MGDHLHSPDAGPVSGPDPEAGSGLGPGSDPSDIFLYKKRKNENHLVTTVLHVAGIIVREEVFLVEIHTTSIKTEIY